MLQVFLRKIVVLAREIADIAVVVRVEGQIADRSNQTVDPEGYHAEEEVRASSGPPPIGLETCWLMIKLPIRPKKKVSKICQVFGIEPNLLFGIEK